jgi:hypothetical protein
MVVSVGAGLGLDAKADAEILAPFAHAVVVAVAQAVDASPAPQASPSPATTPTPLPTATPKAGKLVSRGGPLLFNIGGSLSLGDSSTSSSLGGGGFFTPTPGPSSTPSGPFPFQQATTTNQSLAEIGAGMTASVERRTASTMTSVKIPFGFASTGHSLFGVAQFLYSTPKYSAGYGVQPLMALGQLQLGSTIRGFSFIVPEKNGQATFFQGPALGADDETTKLEGVLIQESRGRALYEAGLIDANGQATGSAKTIDFGTALAGRTLSMIAEGAWQARSGGDGGKPHGVAGQMRLDEIVKAGECSGTARSIPDRFVSFIAGEIYSDKYGDLDCHATKIPVYVDANYEKTGDPTYGISKQTVETLGYSPSLRLGGISFNAIRQDGSSSGQRVWSNTGEVELQTDIFRTSTLLGTQVQQSAEGGEETLTRELLASLRHPIGRHMNVGISGQIQKQTQQNVTTPSTVAEPTATPLDQELVQTTSGLTKGIAFNVSQTWQRTTVQLGDTLTRTISSAANSIQQTPLVNVTRQISPVLSITTSLGEQILRDELNPSANGHTRVFSIAISAPFSYGNSNVTGRVDPRLPATIAGRVIYAGDNASGAGALSNFGTFTGSGGVGNILVTLDNKYVQRTDLTGGFQFSFISPGQHQLTIDTTSMPRGYTAAVPVQTITVEGGQDATVEFMIGTFGGITGHVYGNDANGNPEPLSNVELRVDGGTYSQTDTTGAYGFGGLSAGQHEVSIVPQSIPATADFSPDSLQQKVNVTDGTYTPVDFHAQILGSIAGRILYAKDMGDLAGTGVLNAYVVAEPGEHAAIDEDDGTFIIDDLPAGDYTLSVDPETIRPDLGATPDDVPVHLDPGQHYSGLLFSVGRFEKKVVFTLLSGSGAPAAAPAAVRTSESKLPPKGTTGVTISAPADSKSVAVDAFDKLVALAYDKAADMWSGEIEVPADEKAGTYSVKGIVNGSALPESASLVVDTKLPLVTAQILTLHPITGQTVLVRARFLVDVHPGDKITWQDGTTTVLGKPVTGRIFTFQKQLTLLPLHGLLLTAHGPIPIELL